MADLGRTGRIPVMTAILLLLTASLDVHTQSNGRNQLEGVWAAEAMVRDGVTIPSAGVKPISFEFREQTLIVRGLLGPKAETTPFSTDGTKRPGHIDFTLNKTAIKGLYQLDGDQLTVCFPRKGGDRPAALESLPGEANILLRFKRETDG